MKRIFRMLFPLIAAVVCVLPIIYLLANSFLTSHEAVLSHEAVKVSSFPLHITLRQYESVLLLNYDYYIHFWNSILFVAAILAINVPVSLFAGYGFSQHQFPGKRILFFLYIILMLMPFQATLVPQYLTLQSFGLLNKAASVILPNGFGAFGAFLMTQYMQGIDKELLEAGRLDGLEGFSMFSRLMIPLCKPAVSALVILVFIDNWAMIEQPVVFIRDTWKQPLSVALNTIGTGALFAGGVVFCILPLCIYLYGYKDLVEGISLSSIK